jgi:hypothetical protein
MAQGKRINDWVKPFKQFNRYAAFKMLSVDAVHWFQKVSSLYRLLLWQAASALDAVDYVDKLALGYETV